MSLFNISPEKEAALQARTGKDPAAETHPVG
jgi:hypothetical protein